jgi:hypothetical protein
MGAYGPRTLGAPEVLLESLTWVHCSGEGNLFVQMRLTPYIKSLPASTYEPRPYDAVASGHVQVTSICICLLPLLWVSFDTTLRCHRCWARAGHVIF